MPEERTFKVRWIKTGAKAPADLDAAADATVSYKGAGADGQSPDAVHVVKPSSRGVFSTNKKGVHRGEGSSRVSVRDFRRSSCWLARRVILRVAS